MVLGRDRRSALVANPGDISTWNVADVARALRRARTAQGLRLDEVGQAAGVSGRDLRSLESASLDRFPDSLSALRAVRRSADFLGLPGDQLALVLMERWPLRPPRGVSSEEPTSVVPAVDRDPTVAVASTRTTDTGPPTEVESGGRWRGAERRALFGAATAACGPGTTEVVIDDVRRHANGDGHAAIDGDGSGGDETQAVLVGAGSPAERGRLGIPDDAPPVWLRAVVIAIVVVVLAGVAGILVNNHSAGGGKHRSGSTPSSSTNHSTATTKTTTKVAFTAAHTSPTSADITVGASSFTVTITAVGYPAWVQATSPTRSAPIFSGMLEPGSVQSFTVHQSLTVETGSVAGHAAVTVGSTKAGTYVPPAAPYYMTFKAG
ncbi:MAG: helix-turn-helix domain-containing protein [Acidimicrobiales bacterium]